MNFSKVSNITFPGRLLRLPLCLLPKEITIPVLQGKLKGKKWIVGSSTHGCWLGSYEYSKRRLFEEIVQEGSTVFDIGAHVGFYTLLASVLVGPRGKVFAFEPLPSNLVYLRRHLYFNGITNAMVIEAAVSDLEGTYFLEVSPSRSQAHLSAQGTVSVKTVTLDGLVRRGEIPVPGYLKIDVEGTEELVLRGACSVLARARPTIFLSTHSPALREKCAELLAPFGYRLQKVGDVDLEQADEFIACA